MKHIKMAVSTVLIFTALISSAQDIHFTFENAINTNDGTDDFYEVDVMIQTINTTGTFKLGSGQLYFNYNSTPPFPAFAENIFGSGGFEVTYPQSGGYICGQHVDVVAAGIYGPFTTNDNTSSKVSWAFSQFYSSATFADDNITETPTKLCHLKFKYIDVGEAPLVLFEEGSAFDDQFFTACGPATGGILEPANCGGFPPTQLVNDTFDSSGGTLGIGDFKVLTGITVYPNPTKGMLYINGDVSKLQHIDIYSITGQHVMEVKDSFREIDISSLRSAIYFVKLSTVEATRTFKIIKE